MVHDFHLVSNEHNGENHFRSKKRARLFDHEHQDRQPTDIDMTDTGAALSQQPTSMAVDQSSIPPTSQHVMKLSFAALFPLSFFVAKPEPGRLILKCVFCQRFDHLSHSPPLIIPVENDRQIGNWYDSRLLSRHLGGCLNCSKHQIRTLGTTFSANPVPCPAGNCQILSRYIYHHLQNAPKNVFSPMLPKDQMIQCQNTMKSSSMSESTLVDFHCPAFI